MSPRVLHPLTADQISHHFSSGVYAKEMRFAAGTTAVSHRHQFDHMSILASGRVVVTTPQGVTALVGPAVITMRAGVEHQVEAITDAVWFCIHATEETDVAKIDAAAIIGGGV